MRRSLNLIASIVVIIIVSQTSGMYAQDRRASHPVFAVFFNDIDQPQSRISLGISHKADPKMISRYTEKKSQVGTYLRTEFNVLICEEAPCEQTWSAAFVYTDEAGKRDTIGLIWKQIVFTAITPSGTIKRELTFCLNGKCNNFQDPKNDNEAPGIPQNEDIGRYHLTWAKSSLAITRTDR